MRVAALLAAAVVLTAAAAAVRLSAGSRPCRYRPWFPFPRFRAPPAPSRCRTGPTTAAASATSLPSGTRGHYDALELAAFLGGGRDRPALLRAARHVRRPASTRRRGCRPTSVGRFFKDATFGVRQGDVERRYIAARRRDDRARQGLRRAARLRRDARRGDVRARLRRRRGPALLHGRAAPRRARRAGELRRRRRNARAWTPSSGRVAPYTEADLERQADQLDDVLGAAGAVIQRDVEHYIAGINRYIAEAKLDPTKLPGEYAAIGQPQGPDPWKATDVLATASLVGGIFGKGGGAELQSDARSARRCATALGKRARRARVPRLPLRRGPRGAGDRARQALPVPGPRAPAAHGQPRGPRPRARCATHDVVAAQAGRRARAAPRPPSAALLALPDDRVQRPARLRRASRPPGHPLMVAGPQTGYFNPQILMEQDVHAPGERGPPADRRARRELRRDQPLRPARPRARLRVERHVGGPGQHRHVRRCELCDDTHYRYRGRASRSRCSSKTVAWSPTLGRPDAGRLADAARRAHEARARRRRAARSAASRVIFTRLRSTYFHEVDSAAGFLDFNTPTAITGPETFQQAASRIGYTFNWFYADSEHISYFNSGANPVRGEADRPRPAGRAGASRGAAGTRTPGARSVTPSAAAPAGDRPALPRQLEQQAGARLRVGRRERVLVRLPLADAVRPRAAGRSRGERKLTLPGLIDIMEVAGTGDLRAQSVLPLALRIIGTAEGRAAARGGRAAARMAARRRAAQGRRPRRRLRAQRRGRADGRLVAALGEARSSSRCSARPRCTKLEAALEIDNPPNNHGDHLGSAYQGVLVRLRPQGPAHGAGPPGARPLRARVLRRAAPRPLPAGAAALAARRRSTCRAPELYGGDQVCQDAGKDGDQWCYDAVRQRPDRRRDAAADPLDQPAHLPAGERDRAVGR